jgi:hypothetical protein
VIAAVVVAMIAIASGLPGSGPGVAQAQVVGDQITICHRTNAATNPYVKITVSVNAADGQGNNDHSQHTGPIASSVAEAQDLKEAGTRWGDIIPDHPGLPGGLNWDAEGMALLLDDCSVTGETGEPGSLRVDKVCDPTNDDGNFVIVLSQDGTPFDSNAVTCGNFVTFSNLPPGDYVVSEQAGGGTNLSDYTVVIGGDDCNAAGEVAIESEEQSVCSVTNTRDQEEQPGSLRVDKVCDPTNDDGNFVIVLSQGGNPFDSNAVTCGNFVTFSNLPPGDYVVSEQAGGGTNLSDYTVVIGGDDCESDGDVTIVSEEQSVCTVTNTRDQVEEPGSLRVDKVCDPTNDDGNFVIVLSQGGNPFDSNAVTCGNFVTFSNLPPGDYVVSEQAGGGTDLSDYDVDIGGEDCDSDGDVTIESGEQAECTVTNERIVEENGNIKVKKECEPHDAHGEFLLELDGHEDEKIKCGEHVTFHNVTPGFHSVFEEILSDDFELKFNGCKDIEVESGKTTECKIVNEKREKRVDEGKIVVKKECEPHDAHGEFLLKLDGDDAEKIKCGEHVAFHVKPGAHSVSEVILTDGFDLKFNGCKDLWVESGKTVECKIVNKKVEVKEAAPPVRAPSTGDGGLLDASQPGPEMTALPLDETNAAMPARVIVVAVALVAAMAAVAVRVLRTTQLWLDTQNRLRR